MMKSLALLALLSVLCLSMVSAFGPSRMMAPRTAQGSKISMEYIPDGVSKEQWAAIKKKEADANKGKNLGAVGITKFKSRSFEAWQKSGGKNLFPVDPSVPLEERPYMQRPGGLPDGSDLKKKGLFARGQGAGSARTKIDDKYDGLEKSGQLTSAPWAANLPWTNKGASEYKTPLAQQKAADLAKAKANAKNKKNGAPAKKAPAKKAAVKGKAAPEPEPEPKKKLFGLF